MPKLENTMIDRGFTLIELMIAIAILAIIVGIALPAYNNQIEKTRRADGQAALLNAAQQLERCFTTGNSYAGCAFTAASQDGFYTVTRATATNANTYTLSATPQNKQAGDKCGTLTLDHLGRKGHAQGATGCWGGSR